MHKVFFGRRQVSAELQKKAGLVNDATGLSSRGAYQYCGFVGRLFERTAAD